MYLKSISITGYKNFGNEFSIELNNGLNVLVGENGVGKSAIIDAIRHLLQEDEFGGLCNKYIMERRGNCWGGGGAGGVERVFWSKLGVDRSFRRNKWERAAQQVERGM